jgi:hypothetical protein
VDALSTKGIYNATNFMEGVENAVHECLQGSPHFTVAEMWYWVFRILAGVSLIVLLGFVLIHDF